MHGESFFVDAGLRACRPAGLGNYLCKVPTLPTPQGGVNTAELRAGASQVRHSRLFSGILQVHIRRT
jgi:hypothetical protein